MDPQYIDPPLIGTMALLPQIVDAVRAPVIAAGGIKSAHDCSEGGLAVALAESCMSSREEPIGAFVIPVPPLRDRREDIPPLVFYFAQRFAKRLRRSIESVSRESLDLLCRWPWPGNIRELQNVIERAVILSRGPVLTVSRAEFETTVPTRSSVISVGAFAPGTRTAPMTRSASMTAMTGRNSPDTIRTT